MKDDDKKKLAQRIVKLFALGDSARNLSEAEVSAALTKARELMAEHAFTMDELKYYTGADTDKLRIKLTHQDAYTLRQKFAKYDDQIAGAVGNITDTRSYTTWKWDGGKRFYIRKFLGDEGDVVVASHLFIVLLDAMRKSARQQYGPGWTAKHSNYCMGYSHRLWEKSKDNIPEHLTPPVKEQFALMVRTKLSQADEWLEKNTVTKPIKLKMTKEFLKGRRDAESVDLGNPRRRVEG